MMKFLFLITGVERIMGDEEKRERNCPLGIWKTKAPFFFKILTVEKIT